MKNDFMQQSIMPQADQPIFLVGLQDSVSEIVAVALEPVCFHRRTPWNPEIGAHPGVPKRRTDDDVGAEFDREGMLLGMPSAICVHIERDFEDGGGALLGADQVGTGYAGVGNGVRRCEARKGTPGRKNFGRHAVFHDVEHAADEIFVAVGFEEGVVAVIALYALFGVVLRKVELFAHHMKGSVELLCVFSTVPYRIVLVSLHVIFLLDA